LTLAPSFPGLNLLLGAAGDPRMVLEALAGVTTVKVVSSPSVVVVDNQPATLKVGDEVPISTQQAQNVNDGNAPIINTIRFRETGVILKVTPRVNSSGLVTMDVEQEISQVAGNPDGTSAATLTPTISQRRIASTISVYSGQTVVLGGLISQQDNRDRKSVPLLNRVPLVGDLVGKTTTESRRTELIVFIKPQVIRNSTDHSRVSEEMRDKLRSMTFEPLPRNRLRDWRTHTRGKGEFGDTRQDLPHGRGLPGEPVLEPSRKAHPTHPPRH
jgi:general secretion pathway protein D